MRTPKNGYCFFSQTVLERTGILKVTVFLNPARLRSLFGCCPDFLSFLILRNICLPGTQVRAEFLLLSLYFLNLLRVIKKKLGKNPARCLIYRYNVSSYI
jgi:hypothetical protein